MTQLARCVADLLRKELHQSAFARQSTTTNQNPEEFISKAKACEILEDGSIKVTDSDLVKKPYDARKMLTSRKVKWEKVR